MGIRINQPQGRALLGTARVFSPLVDENGTKALVDLNFERGIFYFNGIFYPSMAALAVAMGVATDNGDGTYTLGPNSNRPFAGYSTTAGTVVCEYINTSATLSLFAWTIQAASNSDYLRRLVMNGSGAQEFDVNSASVAQAQIKGPNGASRQQNYRFRTVDVMTLNDFSSHVSGELIGVDASGAMSAAATSVSAQIGHRAGASKIIGTIYRWTYFPRAVTSSYRPTLSLPAGFLAGGRTWFSNPSTLLLTGGKLFASGATPQLGNIVVGRAGIAPVTINATTPPTVDDHNNGAMIVMANGKALLQYCFHNTNNYYQSISTNDVSAGADPVWGAETDINPQLASTNYSYASLVKLDDGTLVNTHRSNSDATTFTMHITKSTDNAATWSADQKFVAEPSQRSYWQMVKNGPDRVDWICTDGNPDETATSIYHLYAVFTAGVPAYFDSFGVSLGSPPFRPSTQLTRVYDGTGVNGRAWCWSIQIDTSGGGTYGKPVLAFTRLPSTTDHRYCYATFNAGWTVSDICTAGGSLYTESTSEPYYSGGIWIDPDNISKVYCSREVISDGTIGHGGVHQLFTGTTSNGGTSWTMSGQLTSGTDKCYRPTKLPGATVISYNRAFRYSTYLDFQAVFDTMGA